MKCDKIGEMSFPVPFTILAALVTFLLIIANFMRNRTRLFITLMTLIDGVLKLNWFVLFIALGASHEWASFGIIIYCLIANFVVNNVVWRLTFRKYDIDADPEVVKYAKKYPVTYHVLLYISFTFSFHFFRLTYSRILGMTRFSLRFQDS